MSTPEDRMNPAMQGGDGEVSAAHSERLARLGADEASMAAGNAPGHDEQLTFHEGRPTVAEQQVTHGQAAPATPDVGGHG